MFTVNSIPEPYLYWETFKKHFPVKSQNDDVAFLYEAIDCSATWLMKYEPTIYNTTNDFKEFGETKWFDK